MTAIRVHLLTGRYTATGPLGLEWPPDPARLFFAAVNAWSDGGATEKERHALLWWEEQDPPIVSCSGPSEILVRANVGHFVPVNDVAVVRNLHTLGPRISLAERERDEAPTVAARAKAERALASLQKKAMDHSVRAAAPRAGAAADISIVPDGRSKQQRTYPTVRPDNPVIEYRWPSNVPEELVTPLEAVLARIGRLGHPSTLVHCSLDTESTAEVWNRLDGSSPGNRAPGYVPDVNGDLILRVPGPGMLDELEMAYGDHQGRAPRLLPSYSAAYRWVGESSDHGAPLDWDRSDDDWMVFEVVQRAIDDRWKDSHSQPTVNVTRSAEATRALRGALLSHCAEPIPPALSGHRGDRPNDDAHAMFLALPNVGNVRSDGSLTAVAVAVPSECSSADRDRITDAVAAWAGDGSQLWFGGRSVTVEAARIDRGQANFDTRRYTATRSYWARPSQQWMSVTPVALDRHPRALRMKPVVDVAALDHEIEEMVVLMCQRLGLPAPAHVGVIAGPPMVGVPAVGRGRPRFAAFPPYRTEGSGQVRYTTHLHLAFAELVRGPLVLGSGRHFGYGLFLPSDPRSQVKSDDHAS